LVENSALPWSYRSLRLKKIKTILIGVSFAAHPDYHWFVAVTDNSLAIQGQ
jgi:hypothetical protein